MASFTSAAYKILEDEGTPLPTREITRRALDQGLIATRGKTPHQTMRASLYLENKRRLARGEVARFKKYRDDVWGLRNWDDA